MSAFCRTRSKTIVLPSGEMSNDSIASVLRKVVSWLLLASREIQHPELVVRALAKNDEPAAAYSQTRGLGDAASRTIGDAAVSAELAGRALSARLRSTTISRIDW